MRLAALVLAAGLAYLFFDPQTAGVVVAVLVGIELIAWIVRRLRPREIAPTGYRAGRAYRSDQ